MARGEAARPATVSHAAQTEISETPARFALLGTSFAAALALLALFAWLARGIAARAVIPGDAGAGESLHALASPALDVLMEAISFLGLIPVLAVAVVAVSVPLLRRGRRREVALLVVALVGAVALHYALKSAFNRPRPGLPWAHLDTTAAFPSGHAMDSIVAYLGVAGVIWAVWGERAGRVAFAVAVPLVLLIGVSRVYLGLHFVSDVIGGYLAGLCWLCGVFVSFEGWRHRARLSHRGGSAN
jgi:undecaprenyl-diphosphatase